MRNFGRIITLCLVTTLIVPAAFSESLVAANSVGTMTTSTSAPAPETVEALEPSLIAVGTVGAANVYYSYLTIGSAADSFVGGSYAAPLAIAIANEVIYLNTGTMKSLQAMIVKNGLTAEDKNALKFLVDTYDVLNKQAKELVSFISDKKNDGAVYQGYRSDAWMRIQKLFNGAN